MDYLDFACNELDVDKEVIWSKNRKSEIVAKRWAIACFLYELGWNYNQIGRKLNRDHQTVMYALERATLDTWYIAKELVCKFDVVVAPKKKVPNYRTSTIEEVRC